MADKVDRGRVFIVERTGTIAPTFFSYPNNEFNNDATNVFNGQKSSSMKSSNRPDMKVVIPRQNSENIRKTLQYPGTYIQQSTSTSMCLRDHVDIPMLQRNKQKKKGPDQMSFNIGKWK